jgi:eukaryotic-like serine/threonine-protein kinase
VNTGQPLNGLPAYWAGKLIARGGMGEVFSGHDRGLEREIAIKVLQEGYSPNSSAARRFVEEARTTGRLQHPGNPPGHHVGKLPDGQPFLAMKLIRGRTLAEL